jgi:uncharacterized membrane protein YccC
MRRYDPERRAVGHVFLELAKEVDPDQDLETRTPLTPRSADEQATIDALGDDHSIEGERFRLLFDQADRLRLSIYALGRLRDNLGERDDQRSEEAGDAADVLDAVLRLAAKVLQTAGTELISRSATGNLPALKDELQRLAEEAQRQKPVPQVPGIASAVDVLAGQLRLVSDLVLRTEMLEKLKRVNKRAPVALRMQFSSWAGTLRANLDLRSAVCRHAIRLALCVALGDWLERSLGLQRAYWLPMTVAVVLKPDFTSTFSRGLLRFSGTLLGLLLATTLFHLLPPSAATQLLLVGCFTFCLRYLGPANYGIFTLSVSGLVVFLIAATGSSPRDAVVARALNTLAGGLLALVAYAVWPTWERAHVSDSFAEMLEASRLYLQSLFNRLGSDLNSGETEVKHKRLEWQRARSNVEASVDRVLSEPGTAPAQREALLSMLASSHALMLAMTGLEAGILHSGIHETPAELQTFAQHVDFTLYYLAAALRGSKPASANLPQLREDHRKLLEARESLSEDDGYVLQETDRLTVSLNTLLEQVMRYVS